LHAPHGCEGRDGIFTNSGFSSFSTQWIACIKVYNTSLMLFKVNSRKLTLFCSYVYNTLGKSRHLFSTQWIACIKVYNTSLMLFKVNSRKISLFCDLTIL